MSELGADEVVRRVGWAVEAATAAAGIELQPAKVRRGIIEAVGGRARFDEPQRSQVVLEVLRRAPLSALEAREVPLSELNGVAVATSLELVFVGRRGNKVGLALTGGVPQWLDANEAERLVPPQTRWVVVSNAAPLHSLAHQGPWGRLLSLLRLERDDLWVVAIYASAVGLFTLATPVAIQALVGSVAFGRLLQPIVVLSGVLLAALAFQATMRALQAWVVELVQRRQFVRTALDFAWRLPRVRSAERESGFGPATVNRFFEIVTVQKTTGLLLTDGIAYFLQLAIGLLVLAFYHPALLAFDLALMALMALVLFAPLRRGIATSIDESYAKHDVAAWLQQLARGGQLFRTASTSSFATDRAEVLTRRYVQERRAHFSVLFAQKIGTLALQVLASASLLGLGGWLVVIGELTLGQLVAAELIVTAIAGSVARFGKLLDGFYDLMASVDKLGAIVDLELEAASEDGPSGSGALRVKVDSPHLKLEVAAGESVAVVGARGHEFDAWLAGLSAPAEGRVELNGVETTRSIGSRLRNDLALVRDDELFSGTLLDNVLVGRRGLTVSDARAALERVGLLAEVLDWEHGLDTELTTDGAPLSRSQRTRLMLARAIVGRPRLLIVDGQLASLSAADQKLAAGALTGRDVPWTLIALVDDESSELARACTRRVVREKNHA